MGKTLEEYAAKNPQQEPEREREAIAGTARTYRDRQQERDQVEQLKESITRQLQEGNAPQYILYPALQAIGILTHDQAWTDAGKQALDSIYSDLAQQSLMADEEAIAAQRLADLETQYREKLRRQLRTQLRGYQRVEKALREALQATEALDPEDLDAIFPAQAEQ